MASQNEASATDAKWSVRTGFSRGFVTDQINEDAARLSRELRRKLVERLAGLSVQDDACGAPVPPDVRRYPNVCRQKGSQPS
jgi:hypothetical protein